MKKRFVHSYPSDLTRIFFVYKNSTCAVKKLLKINHENTKVRKHEKNNDTKLVDNPPYLQIPCQGFKVYFIEIQLVRYVLFLSYFCDASFFSVLHNLTYNRTGRKNLVKQ